MAHQGYFSSRNNGEGKEKKNHKQKHDGRDNSGGDSNLIDMKNQTNHFLDCGKPDVRCSDGSSPTSTWVTEVKKGLINLSNEEEDWGQQQNMKDEKEPFSPRLHKR